jgi:hypothetical protein
MIRGACIALVCLTIGTYFGYQFKISELNNKIRNIENKTQVKSNANF